MPAVTLHLLAVELVTGNAKGLQHYGSGDRIAVQQ
jgi:hypothetical protein